MDNEKNKNMIKIIGGGTWIITAEGEERNGDEMTMRERERENSGRIMDY